MITCDFETRSAVDIKKSGTYRYASDPSTDVHCLAFKFPERPQVYQWARAYPNAYRFRRTKSGTRSTKSDPCPMLERRPPEVDELEQRLADGELIEAHNAAFERAMWCHVLTPRYDFRPVADSQWRCSAAKAASFALPRHLDGMAKALGLSFQKDMEGNRLMLKLAQPRRPKLAELRAAGYDVPAKDKAAKEKAEADFLRDHGYLWHEDIEELERLFTYCRQDVKVEHAGSGQLRPLPPRELLVWQIDQDINGRGFRVDVEGVRRALALADEGRARALDRVELLTGARTREPVLGWLQEEGLGIEDMQAGTLDAELEGDHLEPGVRDVIRLWRTAGKTSTRKFQAMVDRVQPDERIRDILRYCGAERTGRWAGRGVQPQNFPRGSIKDMDELWRSIRSLDYDSLGLMYPDVMEALSSALRGAICAPDGFDLMAADYSAIEARVTFWVAGCEKGLAAFREIDAGMRPGEDIYTVQASEILGRKITKADGFERQVYGKVPVLGCGYQMGPAKLVSYAAGMGVEISEDRSEELVKGYRQTYPEVPESWYAMERAAIEAVKRGPRALHPVECLGVKWGVRGKFLHARLPSGRLLSYYQPRVRPTTIRIPARKDKPAREFTKDQLTYMGHDTYTHQWVRLSTYGGKLIENVVQAISRDIMADAMVRAQGTPYQDIVLSVHDELVSEVKKGEGKVEEFEALLATLEPWAEGLPIAAEGARFQRYQKG